MEGKHLHELINMPLSSFGQEGGGSLWYIKKIQAIIFSTYLISTIKEYLFLFQHIYNPEMPFEVKSTTKNQKEFESFFTDLIVPVNDALVVYLNQDGDDFNSTTQAALAIVNKSYFTLSTINDENPGQSPQFSMVFEGVFKQVVNHHIERI